MVVPFSKFYCKIWVSFCLNTGKRFFLEFSFSSQQKEHMFFYKAVLGIFKVTLRLRDRHVFMWRSVKILEIFNSLNHFSKNWSTAFQLNALRLKRYHFNTKVPYQKPMLRQIEWLLENVSILKIDWQFFMKKSILFRY